MTDVGKEGHKSNPGSRCGLRSPCDAECLESWFEKEVAGIEKAAVRNVILAVAANLGDFVEWPERALLLWRGCERSKYHRYPDELKRAIAARGQKPNTLSNGPAVTAFLVAGGTRPARFGIGHDWSVHHLYSRKFPHQDGGTTVHAPSHGCHFTQSAGLVAVHPIADGIADELPCFAWRLRAEAFRRFGYDPDGVFGEGHDDLGFVAGAGCEVMWPRESGALSCRP